MSTDDRSLGTPIMRGLRSRCPGCGEGRLFQGFLTLRPSCERCGLDYSFADSADGPAVFVIMISGFIVVFAARTSAEPVALPAPERWSALDPANDEFRRVMFAATIASGREALVYAAGSSVRPDITGVGYWAFAPAELTGGAVVVVNRGFLPD